MNFALKSYDKRIKVDLLIRLFISLSFCIWLKYYDMMNTIYILVYKFVPLENT